MGCKYSIITPVYDESARINEHLGGLISLHEIEKAEVIIVDGNNGSTLKSIDGEFPFTLRTLVSLPGRGTQLIHGARAANGRILVFLHVDTRLQSRALLMIDNALVSGVAGAFRLHVVSNRSAIRFVAGIADKRNAHTHTPYGDQCHFFRTEFYSRLGGYLPIPIMEDVEIMRRIKARKIRISMLPAFAMTDDRRWRKEGLAYTTIRNWVLLILFRMGVAAKYLVRWYRPHTFSRWMSR